MNIIKKFIIATITSILRISSKKKKKKKNFYFKKALTLRNKKKRCSSTSKRIVSHIYKVISFFINYILNENYSLITIKY